MRFAAASAQPVSLVDDWRLRGLVNGQSVETVLDATATRWPDAPAITDLTADGRTLSYGEIAAAAQRVVGHWRSCGIRPGEVVLLMSPNCNELIATIWAAFSGGYVAVPVVEIYRDHEVQQLVRAVRPSAVVAMADDRAASFTGLLDGALDEQGSACRSRVVLRGEAHGWTNFDELMSSNDAAVAASPSRSAQDPVVVLFTSGTSASPKGVVHSSSSLLAEVRQQVWAKGLGWQDRGYVGVTMAHLAGLLNGVLIPGMIGSSVVLSRTSSLATTASEILEHDVTDASGPPTLLEAIVTQAANSDRLMLRRWWTGGMGVTREQIGRAEELGVAPFRTYGLTEFPTVTQGSDRDPAGHRLDTDGRVAPGVQCQAVDASRRPVPTGEQGKLRVRGPERMLGYLDRKATEEATDADGWFYTGDLGIVDGDGCVVITGRIKEIINRGGEKFSARDIEDVLSRHPAVDRVAVVAGPDPKYGEVPVAFLSHRAGTSQPTTSDLEAFLVGQGMARQKVPQKWRWVESFPETSLGKIRKRELLVRTDDRA